MKEKKFLGLNALHLLHKDEKRTVEKQNQQTESLSKKIHKIINKTAWSSQIVKKKKNKTKKTCKISNFFFSKGKKKGNQKKKKLSKQRPYKIILETTFLATESYKTAFFSSNMISMYY
ncbi:hypothetical protein RFI_11869 [Reticulomyxa filosa]|uniref:Uncharacterized protein n=1 Tax=Reticulomyxa filosa TaxID=46433 RepID=X6NH96_RETFI|nr:hypothetical protein RFI_11869 [Reticulomyxa filosa]|eukprot:ETO25268.1 hypothetical protein RFI_11869 [Reticulomyxa filosa]